MTLIGLSGYARSGKDSAAAHLLAQGGWERRAFADKLREFLHALNPLLPALHPDSGPLRLATYVDVVGWERAKDEHPEVRALLQRCGTDAGRKVLGGQVWVEAATRCLPPTGSTVFTDCRFPNEVDVIRERGGIIVRVERPGFGPKLSEDGAPHVSEVALDGYPFDHVIVNDGTLGDLGRAITAVTRLHAVGATQAARRGTLPVIPAPRTPGD